MNYSTKEILIFASVTLYQVSEMLKKASMQIENEYSCQTTPQQAVYFNTPPPPITTAPMVTGTDVLPAPTISQSTGKSRKSSNKNNNNNNLNMPLF